jgi:hypothetical protein
MNATNLIRLFQQGRLWACIVGIMAGCTSGPAIPPAEPSPTTEPPTKQRPVPPTGASLPGSSYASSPRDYRRDAASHLYAKFSSRIYAGKLPPMLYAVGVLQVEINGKGIVTGLHWMRAPSHAPEVVAEIERSVRSASPFPAPVKMSRVTYTDTWLWDKSGRFQLDTLTEGQL